MFKYFYDKGLVVTFHFFMGLITLYFGYESIFCKGNKNIFFILSTIHLLPLLVIKNYTKNTYNRFHLLALIQFIFNIISLLFPNYQNLTIKGLFSGYLISLVGYILRLLDMGVDPKNDGTIHNMDYWEIIMWLSTPFIVGFIFFSSNND